jgi:hypothetical protein
MLGPILYDVGPTRTFVAINHQPGSGMLKLLLVFDENADRSPYQSHEVELDAKRTICCRRTSGLMSIECRARDVCHDDS